MKQADYYINAGMLHPAGLRFAINIDSAMFQVYSAPATKRAWNDNIVTTGSSPSTCVVNNDASTGNNTLLALYSNQGQLWWTWRLFQGRLGALEGDSSAPALLPPVTGSNLQGPARLSTTVVGSIVVVTVSDTSGHSNVYRYFPESARMGALFPVSEGLCIYFGLYSGAAAAVAIDHTLCRCPARVEHDRCRLEVSTRPQA